jgi:hypothetical protein
VRKGIELSEKPLNKLSEKEVRSAGLRHDFNVYAVQKKHIQEALHGLENRK